MKLTEARVGLLSIAATVVGVGIVMWADVRDNTRDIAELQAQREAGRKAVTAFLRDYERKEQADSDDIEMLADHEARIRALELANAARSRY